MNLQFSQTQTPVDLDSPEPLWFGSQGPRESVVPPVVEPVVESGGESGLRRKWSPMEDKILIGAWLNTSKDPIISNEQKAGSFWRRIVDYYNASPQLVGTVPRELGCYDAALREQRSGQNDDDVMKAALEIFFKTTESKFSMDHCWRELRHDQKWCSVYGPKEDGKEKRKQVIDVDREEEEAGEPEGRPPGVKAAKAGIKKKKSGREEELGKLQGVLEVKEKLSRAKILDRLLAKKEPLTEMETNLKMKLMSEML
ncbi:glutathione S-transferase T3-like [Brassica napus]|uniref:glutathione S-transferase T3-like n=1 Tax=Brassica napus TaxID=3708 RepID=UPI002078F0D0|nr:glutathione S-transferase T3-like [Brassica napus]